MDEEKIRKLIALVSHWKELFDSSNDCYKNQSLRDQIWAEIAKVVEEDVDTCKLKWKTLRDGFRRAMKSSNTITEQGNKTTINWKYWDSMSFLLPYIKEKGSNPNVYQEDKKDEDKEDSNSDSDDNIDPVTGFSFINSQPATSLSYVSSEENMLLASSTISAARKPESFSELIDEQATYKKRVSLERETTLGNKTDQIVDFFNNMGKTVATFSPCWQAIIKSKVFQIVNSAEIEFLGGIYQEVPIAMNTSVPTQNLSGISSYINFPSCSYNMPSNNVSFMSSPDYYSTLMPRLSYSQHTSNPNVMQRKSIQTESAKVTKSLSKKKNSY